MPATVPGVGSLTGGNVFSAGRGLESLKGNFFDREAVVSKVEKKKRAILSKFGAFVRARAISSMLGHNVPKGFGHKSKVTDREGSSAPGQPPNPHTGLLVKWILFAWDQAAGGVVVGPMKLNMVSFDRNRRPVTGTVPQVLEYGGQITILEWYLSHLGIWQRADLRFKRKLAERATRYRTVNIAARPFMRPAERAERPRFAPLFKGMI
jgi:hypothetical protein